MVTVSNGKCVLEPYFLIGFVFLLNSFKEGGCGCLLSCRQVLVCPRIITYMDFNLSSFRSTISYIFVAFEVEDARHSQSVQLLGARRNQG
jgi:hypothetical protein